MSAKLLKNINALENAVFKAEKIKDLAEQAAVYGGSVISAMDGLRSTADGLEALIAKKYWNLPSYAELLFGVI